MYLINQHNWLLLASNSMKQRNNVAGCALRELWGQRDAFEGDVHINLLMTHS